MSQGHGIRATVEIDSPGACPLAALSADLEAPIRVIRTSVPPTDGTPAVIEFAIEEEAPTSPALETVFTVGDLSVCRTVHAGNVDCPCTALGRHQTPLSRLVAEDGSLTLVFYTPTFEELQSIMDDLQVAYPGIDVRRLIREPSGYAQREYAVVDAGGLTDRQRQLLELAHERGYFDRPRAANATELAAEIGIDPSTFREHLTVGLRKILDDVLLCERPPQ